MTKQDSWQIVQTIKECKEIWLRKAIEQGKLLQLILEGKIEGKRPRGRRRNGVGTYQHLKKETKDR